MDMKIYRHLIAIALITGLLPPAVAADERASLDVLLKQVQQGRIDESQENQAREEEFKRNKANQGAMLQKANNERAALEAVSERLEKEFEANQDDIDILKQDLQEALGSLKELFGVLQTAAGDSRATFDASLTNIEYPYRGDLMTSLADGHDLKPAILRGSACASITVSRPGCAPALPDTSTLEAFLADHPGPTKG